MSEPLNFLPIIARVSRWPEDFISVDSSAGYLSRVAIKNFTTIRAETGYTITYSLYVRDLRAGEEEKGFGLALITGLEAFIEVGSSSESFNIWFTHDDEGEAVGFDTSLSVRFLLPLAELF